MPSIHIARVSFAYSDPVPILKDVELRLDLGWYGLVGANGAGKTTFLKLIAGALAPDQGAVAFHPRGGAAVYCPQEVEELTPDLRAFAQSDTGLARRLLGELDLEPAQLDRWDTLSPGERKRWQVGAALASEPFAMLLDEPTNHLDAGARDLLVAALRGFGGVGLVISHDRALLEELTCYTVRFYEGEVRCYRGGYGTAKAAWDAEERERQARWRKLRGEQAKLESRLGDRRRQKAQASADMRTSRRMKSRKDSSARAAFKAKRRRSADVSLGREIQKTHHRLERVADQLDGLRFRKGVGRSLFVDYTPARVPELFRARAPELRAGDRVLLRDVDVTVARESRIRVAGPNGIGKTTLLRALLAGSRVRPDRVLYLPQQLDADDAARLLEAVRALDSDSRGRLMALVAALGVAPEPLLASGRPSPGEARKLALAYGLARQVWALVLDEPTNHLDLPSIERLELALESYPGALVLVTHDDAFARRLTDTTWQLRDARIWIS